MPKFDDFVETKGDLTLTYTQLAQRYVKIFLNKIDAKYVEDLLVKFITQPFLDISFLFYKNGQIIVLDHNYIKQKSLKQQYESTLAQIFCDFSYKQIEDMCKNLTQTLKTTYIKKEQ